MDDDSRQPLHPVIQGLKTVCRCNNIKYRTIERAIREGATTLHQVATRTTATTGHCGGSCAPDVQEMIADLAPKRPVAAPPAPNKSENADAWWLRKK